VGWRAASDGHDLDIGGGQVTQVGDRRRNCAGQTHRDTSCGGHERGEAGRADETEGTHGALSVGAKAWSDPRAQQLEALHQRGLEIGEWPIIAVHANLDDAEAASIGEQTGDLDTRQTLQLGDLRMGEAVLVVKASNLADLNSVLIISSHR